METQQTHEAPAKRHWLVSLWPAWLIAALFAYNWYDGYTDRKEQQRAKAAQEAAQAQSQRTEAERAAALLKRCTDEETSLTRTAEAALAKGQMDEARAALQPCRAHLTGAAAQAALKRLDAMQAAATARLERERAANMAKIAAAEKAEKKRKGVSIGMTKQDVLDSMWGRPQRINTTTTASSVREQWVYDGGYLYFTNGVLTSIQN